MKKKTAGLLIVKIIYCAIVFVAAIVVMSILFNRGNIDMIGNMGKPSLPIVSFKYGNYKMNCLYGYTTDMNQIRLRDNITPLMSGRKLSVYIDTYGENVSKISYEVRSADASRLIEDTTVYNYLQDGNTITADITLKDLIEDHEIYLLCIKLVTNEDKVINYYTRIIEADDYDVESKLEYVYYFTGTTFDKADAKAELSTYMESNKNGDNSTFNRVDIHSSMEQLTWGNLNVERDGTPIAQIKEIDEDAAVIDVNYFVAIKSEDKTEKFSVKDTYRFKNGAERMYLLEFYREMNQIFSLESAVIVNNKIMLGITDTDVNIKESEDGKNFAFVNSGRLYSYNSFDNKIVYAFGFYEDGNEADIRTNSQNYDIKIFRIDENGNIYFMVYGYMPRGINEGKEGMAIYYYDSVLNTVEEKAFLEYPASTEEMNMNVDTLCYVSPDNILYVYTEDAIVSVDLGTIEDKVIAENIPLGGLVVSKDNTNAAWLSGGDYYNASQIVWKNLETGKETYVQADEGTRIVPIGFFKNDLIYAIASKEDIIENNDGTVTYAMNKIIIRDEKGTVLKEYSENDIYIVGVEVYEDMISLERCRKVDGEFIEWTGDQILDNNATPSYTNAVESVVTENYETIVQIVAEGNIDVETLKILNPGQVIFEDNRNIESLVTCNNNYYYVYILGKMTCITKDAREAIAMAYDGNGTVTDIMGKTLYSRGTVATRNQIMDIECDESVEKEQALAVCINTILEYNGITYDCTQDILDGESSVSILSQQLYDKKILNLVDTDIEVLQYYLNQDIPVLVEMDSGEAMVVVGYNENQLALMDPIDGSVYKKGITECESMFIRNGYRFVTYVNYSENG